MKSIPAKSTSAKSTPARTWCRLVPAVLLAAVLSLPGNTQAVPAAVPGHAPSPHPEPAAQARREIRRLYQVLDARYGRRDADGQLALYQPGYAATDEKGRRVTYASLSAAVRRQCARDRRIQQEPGRVLRTFQRTTPRAITVSGGRARVLWSGHAEALSKDGGAWARVTEDSAGEDGLVRTARGWRFASGSVAASRQAASGGLTPEAALAVGRVFQAKALLDQEIAGEQASDDQQQRLRIEQDQHDEQARRRRHGE